MLLLPISTSASFIWSARKYVNRNSISPDFLKVIKKSLERARIDVYDQEIKYSTNNRKPVNASYLKPNILKSRLS